MSGGDFLRSFLEERGIAPDGDVARERGYAPYCAGDVDAVYAAMEQTAPGLMQNKSGRRNPGWVERFTKSEGFVIPKYRVLDHLHPIRPQLRPKEEAPENLPYFRAIGLPEGVWQHNHSENAVGKDGKPLPHEELAAHIEAKNRRDEHEDIGPEQMHTHREAAKYGIAPEERDVWKRQKETGKWVLVRSLAAYLGLAYFDDSKRLDVNPVSRADFALPGPVFFGIEGTPKNDAMVEWLRKHGRPAKVVNVPSVSTWKAPELALFAIRHMRGHPVVIVPDADWFENDEVIYHAENCAIYLRQRCGVENVVIAAPPVAKGYKGVDDFLGSDGKGGGGLDDLEVIRRDFDHPALHDWEREYRETASRRGARGTEEFDLSLARLLGRTSGSHGATLRNVSALAPLVGGGSIISEEEALQISAGYEIPGDAEYTEEQKHKTYRGLDRLAGEAFEHTGRFPEWIKPHYETVGWEEDKKTGKRKPQRRRKPGSMGSRIEYLRMDDRLRVHQVNQETLGVYIGQVFTNSKR